VFPVPYGLDFYILFRRNPVFKGLNVDEREGYEESECCNNIEEAFLLDDFINVTWKCRINCCVSVLMR
jgi:hypothetical protein